MKISFHGAARTVTGSKHLIHLDNGKQILLDCGLFQGLGKETLELNSNWGFEPKDVTYVIISHAHIDHVGLLPKLVKDGFNGKIYCTPQTLELGKLLMLDSAHIQEMEETHINRIRERQQRPLIDALYTEDDVQKVLPLIITVPYNEPYKIDNDIELLYTNAGHILGSAAVSLKLKESGKTTALAFSGDIGRYNDMILASPEDSPQADYIIMESTYGNKLHSVLHSATDKLLDVIEKTCIERKGKLIIPAFSVGRTQEILYLLNRLDTEHRLPKLNYYVDSPLSIEATQIMKNHPECFNEQVRDLLKKDDDVFDFPGLHYTQNVDESIALTASKEACVIISASGMAEAGRVKHHIAANIGDPYCTIMLVGYCEPRSLGGQLHNGAKEVYIYGEHREVKANIESIDSMSAHADYDDLLKWLSCQNAEQVQNIYLVHGEYDVQQAFREKLLRKGFKHVSIPCLHEETGNLGIGKLKPEVAR
ncbi:MAG: MBL fold metallo-hydrolase [Flavipsychrobacter sp.]|nr:MBL fold metallo-hydrolase [Flavipsychrobacter sp.]